MSVSAETGTNLPNSVADVALPFPDDWERELRRISPKTELHSWLLPYWYRAGERWVLYDALPRACIHPDENQGAPVLGSELLAALDGPPPRELEAHQVLPFVSDVQHEMYRLHKVYARPFWVLQGERGGHQVRFSPWQKNVLAAKGLPDTAPAIGSLPACPFDNRVIDALAHLNRLFAMDMNVEALRKSASPEAADREMERVQREMRDAEMAFIEQQMTPLVELVGSVRKSSAHQSEVIYTAPGSAARAKDALDAYRETGQYAI